MIDNSLPPMGKFYTEAKANEMVADERAKWLKALEDIKAEIEEQIDRYDDRNISEYEDCLAIIERKIAEVTKHE